jgi:hypothetical protein
MQQLCFYNPPLQRTNSICSDNEFQDRTPPNPVVQTDLVVEKSIHTQLAVHTWLAVTYARERPARPVGSLYISLSLRLFPPRVSRNLGESCVAASQVPTDLNL